jgi:hypothetical protein
MSDVNGALSWADVPTPIDPLALWSDVSSAGDPATTSRQRAADIVPWHPESWREPASYESPTRAGTADADRVMPRRQLRYRYDTGSYEYRSGDPDWLHHELTTRSTEVTYKGASVRRDRRFVDTKAYASPEGKVRAGNAILASEATRHWLGTVVLGACVAAFLLVLLWAAMS